MLDLWSWHAPGHAHAFLDAGHDVELAAPHPAHASFFDVDAHAPALVSRHTGNELTAFDTAPVAKGTEHAADAEAAGSHSAEHGATSASADAASPSAKSAGAESETAGVATSQDGDKRVSLEDLKARERDGDERVSLEELKAKETKMEQRPGYVDLKALGFGDYVLTGAVDLVKVLGKGVKLSGKVLVTIIKWFSKGQEKLLDHPLGQLVMALLSILTYKWIAYKKAMFLGVHYIGGSTGLAGKLAEKAIGSAGSPMYNGRVDALIQHQSDSILRTDVGDAGRFSCWKTGKSETGGLFTDLHRLGGLLHPTFEFESPHGIIHIRLVDQTTGELHWDAMYNMHGATQLKSHAPPMGGSLMRMKSYCPPRDGFTHQYVVTINDVFTTGVYNKGIDDFIGAVHFVVRRPIDDPTQSGLPNTDAIVGEGVDKLINNLSPSPMDMLRSAQSLFKKA